MSTTLRASRADLRTRAPFAKREHVLLHVVGFALTVAGVAMLVCALIDELDGAPDAIRFVIAGAAVFVPGLVLWRRTSPPARVSTATIYATAFAGWVAFALAGTLPFLVTGAIDRFDNALFESVAGFTTTASTVLTNLDGLSEGILLWRSIEQWLGGICAVVFFVSVLPFLHSVGVEHLAGVAPQSGADRLAPRVRDVARRLVFLYILFTIVVGGLYALFGMKPFDAAAHAFTTVSTGGFSTHDQNFAYFNSPALQWTAIAAMVIAGGNFALYWRALRGRPFAILRSVEFRLYLAIIAAIGAAAIYSNAITNGWSEAVVRRTLFTTVSITSTTGFSLLRFDRWTGSVQLLLLFAMAVGAMAGSVGSGFKLYRVMGIVGHVRRHVFRQLHPRAVPVVRIGREIVPDAVLSRILGFFGLFMGVGAAATFAVAALGRLDLTTSIGAVATNIGNVGPGLGRLHPGTTYLVVSAGARWVLMGVMLAGRLEVYPVLLGLVPLARAVSDRLPPRAAQALVRIGRG